jgi:putative ABC transport system substrate-binding protein
MSARIDRREFITIAGATAVSVTSGFTARAQQRETPTIGFLSSRAPGTETHLVAAFREGLADKGFFEGQNIAIEYRWAEGQYDRLPALATELVRRGVLVIATAGSALSAQAAKTATASIPIVFATGDDPVKLGLVASLNRPGGNATGVAVFVVSLLPKRLQLLRELIPSASTIGLLRNPKGPAADEQLAEVQSAARALDVQLDVLAASTAEGIDQAFSVLAQRRPHALLLGADPYFQVRRDQLVALAARHAIPAMYEFREFVEAGGLISYSPRRTDTMRQMGVYTAQILRGAKPADLPVVQPTKFELVINLNTARGLALAIPPAILAIADEVIE